MIRHDESMGRGHRLRNYSKKNRLLFGQEMSRKNFLIFLHFASTAEEGSHTNRAVGLGFCSIERRHQGALDNLYIISFHVLAPIHLT